MQNITNLLNTIDSLVWGPPLLILLVGTGLFLTLRLNALQVVHLPKALKLVFAPSSRKASSKTGDVTPFAALCTALSATIGTGNIVGVATAIAAGGPGALFWMWIAAFFGMATKYAEALLAIKYRVVDENGQMAGGPMYYLERGLNNKLLARMFALFGIGVAFFGIGTFAQVNAIADAAKLTFDAPIWVTAVILTTLVAAVTLGGIRSIAAVASRIVPLMAVIYIITSLAVILLNLSEIPAVISLIIDSAFNPTAAFGGATGVTMLMVMRNGVARGVFSNESGLGSAPIAAAAAQTDSCVRQGLIAMTGTFFDTIIVCTMTGIVLVLTGAWNTPGLAGAAMTNSAFAMGLGSDIGKYAVTIGLMFFAFTTIIGWNYYGERCTAYLFGVNAIKPYRLIYIGLIACGAFLKLDLIWILADIVNGLMAIPNLIGLLGLSSVVVNETREFFAKESTENTSADAVLTEI